MMYPKTKFLKISMIFSSFLGIFPWQLLSPTNEILRKIYAAYSKIMLGAFMLFTFTLYMGFFDLIREDPLRLEEITRCAAFSLLYTITLVRQFVLKIHPGIRKLLQHIIDSEKDLVSTNELEVLKIYEACSKLTTNNIIGYSILLSLSTFAQLIRPFFKTEQVVINGNQTLHVAIFPAPSWSPFDEKEHFLPAYIISFSNVLFGASYVCYTDMLMLSLIMYPIGQLQILHHILANFDKYKEKIRLGLDVEGEDRIGCITFRCCIDKHRTLIEYIKDFNGSMRVFMMVDFLQSSLQIASIVVQLVVTLVEKSLWKIVLVCFMLSVSSSRLLIYYYYSNEVLILSETLGSSIWESNWYEQPAKVRFMMRMFMMRAANPLKFDIGPFGFMTLNTFIAIMKASYSYTMLMCGTGKGNVYMNNE